MIYYAIVRYHATGNNKRLTFVTVFARALCLVALTPYITIVEEGTT